MESENLEGQWATFKDKTTFFQPFSFCLTTNGSIQRLPCSQHCLIVLHHTIGEMEILDTSLEVNHTGGNETVMLARKWLNANVSSRVIKCCFTLKYGPPDYHHPSCLQ